jgi:hypothetical protein
MQTAFRVRRNAIDELETRITGPCKLPPLTNSGDFKQIFSCEDEIAGNSLKRTIQLWRTGSFVFALYLVTRAESPDLPAQILATVLENSDFCYQKELCS